MYYDSCYTRHLRYVELIDIKFKCWTVVCWVVPDWFICKFKTWKETYQLICLYHVNCFELNQQLWTYNYDVPKQNCVIVFRLLNVICSFNARSHIKVICCRFTRTWIRIKIECSVCIHYCFYRCKHSVLPPLLWWHPPISPVMYLPTSQKLTTPDPTAGFLF